MARIDTLANFITDIATAIKAKTGKTDPITPANFDTEINSIQGGDSGDTLAPLANGYTRLLCIESTGSQYITTDLMVSDNTNFSVTFRTFSGFTQQSFACIFGTRYTYNDNGYSLTTYPGSTSPSNTGHFLLDGTRYSSGMNPGSVSQTIRYKDGALLNESGVVTYVSVTATPPDPMAIFGVYDTLGKGVADTAGQTALYALTFEENGEVVADYIPAMRDSDGEVGLYDMVSGKFYTNSGTGSFRYEKMVINNVETEEDLTEELNTYNTELTEQEMSIQNIIGVLQNKAISGSDAQMNVFCQSEEPETKDGVWVRNNNINPEKIDITNNIIAGVEMTSIKSVSNLPTGLREASVCSVGTDVYVINGTTSGSTLSSIYKYDTINDTYTYAASMGYAAYGVASATDGTDIYIFGGRVSSAGRDFTFKYDTLTGNLTQLPSMPYRTGQLQAVRVEREIYLFGGYDGNLLTKALKYNIDTGEYTTLPDLPSARNCAAVCANGSTIYIAGGYTGGTLSELLAFDTITNTYRLLSCAKAKRVLLRKGNRYEETDQRMADHRRCPDCG